MQLARPVFALHPKQFGRGRTFEFPLPRVEAASTMGNDLKLFATTFLAGFVFVSILIS